MRDMGKRLRMQDLIAARARSYASRLNVGGRDSGQHLSDQTNERGRRRALGFALAMSFLCYLASIEHDALTLRHSLAIFFQTRIEPGGKRVKWATVFTTNQFLKSIPPPGRAITWPRGSLPTSSTNCTKESFADLTDCRQ